ncbi:MAG: ABC transporter substrate-binding protein [Defluviitaleaceae bacterium]|nr:ABC transporter substrate-binding protein [Defluviitaleaceae bacterium]
MKRNTLLVILIIVLFVVAVVGVRIHNNDNDNNELTTIRLNEVVRSIFYAPQYVAIEMGFFEEEGILIELSIGQGADRSMVALISGSADIGLMGTEAAIYVFNEGREDHAMAFAQANYLKCVN